MIVRVLEITRISAPKSLLGGFHQPCASGDCLAHDGVDFAFAANVMAEREFGRAPPGRCDARIMGADCVLLIAAALDDAELADFHQLARAVGLDVLVEIHDEAELERALKIDPDLIGVNQRDLVTFEVDQARARRVAPLMPDGVVRVAESGIRGADDVVALTAAGYHAVLVGETLVKAGDPAAAVKSLRVAAHRQR